MDTTVTLRKPADRAECARHMVPINDVLAQIGGKWTIYIITALSEGPKRFGELRRHIDGVSQKMLTQTLRQLHLPEVRLARGATAAPPDPDPA